MGQPLLSTTSRTELKVLPPDERASAVTATRTTGLDGGCRTSPRPPLVVVGCSNRDATSPAAMTSTWRHADGSASRLRGALEFSPTPLTYATASTTRRRAGRDCCSATNGASAANPADSRRAYRDGRRPIAHERPPLTTAQPGKGGVRGGRTRALPPRPTRASGVGAWGRSQPCNCASGAPGR
jgi:hypothetical protein